MFPRRQRTKGTLPRLGLSGGHAARRAWQGSSACRARARVPAVGAGCVRACVRDAPPAGRTSALPCVGRAGARGREAGSCCVRRALAALIAPSPAAGAACVCAGKEAANTLARSLSLSLFLSLLASCPRALPACVQTETARHGSTGPTQPERAAHTLWPVARMAEPRAARGAWWGRRREDETAVRGTCMLLDHKLSSSMTSNNARLGPARCPVLALCCASARSLAGSGGLPACLPRLSVMSPSSVRLAGWRAHHQVRALFW